MNKKLITIVLLFFLLIANTLSAAVIKGIVTDVKTNEKLPYAVILILDTKLTTTSDMDGTFIFKNISPGKYTLLVKYIGYHNSEKKVIRIQSEGDIVNLDFSLSQDVRELSQVIVHAKINRESEVSARKSEKEASNVMNVISAKAIENLPDMNVANVMQRVSGISMIKNSVGNNSQLVIRGMPPRYNGTLIDGVTIPSTSTSSRSVPLEIIPSALIGRIEVVKALTPEMEANGLGGTANLKMKDAPDTAMFNVDISTGYGQYFFDHKLLTFNKGVVSEKNPAELHGNDYITSTSDFPTGNLSIQRKQAPPDFNAGLSWGRRFYKNKLGVIISGALQNTYQGTINKYYSTSLNPNTNAFDIDSWNTTEYCSQQFRTALNARLDYEINKYNYISLYNTYFRLNETRARQDIDTLAELNKGEVHSSDLTNIDKSGIESFTLHGQHVLFPKLDIDWSLIYSIASSNSPDLVTVSYIQQVPPAPATPKYLNYSDCVSRVWQWNTDIDRSASVNINYKPEILEHEFDLKFGGFAKIKNRKNYGNEYDFNAPSNNVQFPNPDIRVVFDQLTRKNDQQAIGDPVNYPGNYRASENIEAGYAQVKTDFGKIQILTGARVEFTYQSNEHNQVDRFGQVTLTNNTFSYYDVLPSLHLRYELNGRQNIRFSVYTAINRPNYTELIQASLPNGDGSHTNGNPGLQHTTGTCFDLRYEIYPDNEAVISFGAFYKELTNAIEAYTTPNGDRSFGNVPKCNNYGFELVFIKYFGNFGLNANYTLTQSQIQVIKIWNTDTSTIQRNENRPLVGQSPHIINAGLIYRNREHGLLCQVTYTMQGKNCVSPSSYYGLDSYQLTNHNLGANIEKHITKSTSVYIKGSNLLNTILKYQTKSGFDMRELYTKRQFIFGIKFNL